MMWRFLLGLMMSSGAQGLTVSQISPEPTFDWGTAILVLLAFIFFLAVMGWLAFKLHSLKKSYDHLSKLMGVVPESLLEITCNGEIQAVTHTSYPYESPIENLIGTSVEDYLDNEQAEVFRKQLTLAFEELHCRIFRLDVTFDDKRINLQCRIIPTDRKPNAKTGLLIVTDITRFKEAERTLEAARQQAEDLAQGRASFLANMSHELRTPLAGIVGMVSLIEDTYASDEMHQYTQPLLSSVDHLRRIVDDVLELSKADGGNIVLEERDMCLWQILDDLEGLFAQQAMQKGIDFQIVQDISVPRYIHIDGFRLRQVLYNLVGNAVKFTESGSVRLEINVRQLAHRTFLHFAVIDTGIGIDNQQQQRIFDAFRQADASTSRQHGGTGLGLSICKKLVELMGGIIEVQSEPGHGSTFWFTVPLSPLNDRDDVSYWQKRGVQIAINNPLDRQWIEQFFNGLKIPHSEKGALLVTDHLARDDAQWVWWLGEENDRNDSHILWLQPPLRRMVLMNRLMNDQAPKDEQDSDAILDTAGQDMEQTILIVEDNPTNELVLRRLLEKMGYCVASASNGKEGVERWESSDFDAIIMDVQMPIMDGIDATKAIRQQENGRYTPIIALTANAQKSIEEACFSAGTDAFLTKPVDRAQLQNTLAAVLGGHKVSSSA